MSSNEGEAQMLNSANLVKNKKGALHFKQYYYISLSKTVFQYISFSMKQMGPIIEVLDHVNYCFICDNKKKPRV